MRVDVKQSRCTPKGTRGPRFCRRYSAAVAGWRSGWVVTGRRDQLVSTIRVALRSASGAGRRQPWCDAFWPFVRNWWATEPPGLPSVVWVLRSCSGNSPDAGFARCPRWPPSNAFWPATGARSQARGPGHTPAASPTRPREQPRWVTSSRLTWWARATCVALRGSHGCIRFIRSRWQATPPSRPRVSISRRARGVGIWSRPGRHWGAPWCRRWTTRWPRRGAGALPLACRRWDGCISWWACTWCVSRRARPAAKRPWRAFIVSGRSESCGGTAVPLWLPCAASPTGSCAMTMRPRPIEASPSGPIRRAFPASCVPACGRRSAISPPAFGSMRIRMPGGVCSSPWPEVGCPGFGKSTPRSGLKSTGSPSSSEGACQDNTWWRPSLPIVTVSSSNRMVGSSSAFGSPSRSRSLLLYCLCPEGGSENSSRCYEGRGYEEAVHDVMKATI